MAKVTGFTAARMFEIEQSSIISAAIEGGDELVFYTRGGERIRAGAIRGGTAEWIEEYTPIVDYSAEKIKNFEAVFAELDEKVADAVAEGEDAKNKALTALEEAFAAQGGVSGALTSIQTLDTRLTAELTTAQSAADAAGVEATEAKSKALTALEEAFAAQGGVSGALTSIQTLDTRLTAELADAEVRTAAAATAAGEAKADVLTAINKANSAVVTAGEAKTAANTAQADATTAQSAAQQAKTAADAAKATADTTASDLLTLSGKSGRVIRSTTAPTGNDRNANNLWLNTTTGQLSEWTGSAWKVITDSRLTAATSAAASAQTKADQAANTAGAAQERADLAKDLADAANLLADIAGGKADTAQITANQAKADAAQAKTDATNKSAAAQAAAEAYAKEKAESEAAAAKSDALAQAAVDAKTKADAAKAEALAGASTDAKAKADAAEAAAKAAAALDAKAKADAAEAAAKAAAALDAKAKADKALADAKADATAKSNAVATSLANFSTTVTADLALLQTQVDGAIETWFYAGVPTLSSLPASGWGTEALRKQHEGDLYFDKTSGRSYRFFKEGTTWKWSLVQDNDISAALTQAARAQDTADSKRKTFVAQPVPPYEVGDLWAQGATGGLMRCITARASGVYTPSDWGPATGFTDDTEANAAKALAQTKADAAEAAAKAYALAEAQSKAAAAEAAAKAAAALDAKNKADAAQAAAIASSSVDAKNKADKALADAKIAADAYAVARAAAAREAAEATAALDAKTKADAAQAAAEAKAATAQAKADQAFVNAATADGKAVAAQAAATAAGSSAATAQSKADSAFANAATAQSTANQAKTAASSAQTKADTAAADLLALAGKSGRLIRSASAPTSADDKNVNNLWLNTGNGQLSQWSGSAWTLITDSRLTAATNAAATAQTTADQAKTNAATAQAKADSAFTNAATAKTAADNAMAKALGAQSTADTADAKASTADGRVTVGSANPVASDGVGKPVNAIWEVKSGSTVLRRFMWTGSTWTQVKAGQDFVGDKAIGRAQVADVAIGTAQVADAAITNAKVGTLAASKIDAALGQFTTATIGALVGDESFIRYMYSSKVVVSADNLIPDPYFDLGTAVWNVYPEGYTSPGTSSISSDVTYQNHPYSVRLMQKAAGTSNMALYGPNLRDLLSVMPTCTPGEKIVASCMYYIDKALPAGAINSGFSCQVYFYDEAGTMFSNRGAGVVASPPVGSWFQAGGNPITVPSGAVSFRVVPSVYLNVGYTPNDAKVYIGQVEAKRQVGSVLIENGAVNADKITASQELSAKVAEFLSVKTGQITWDNAAGNNAFIGSLVGNDAFFQQLMANRLVVTGDNLIPDPTLSSAATRSRNPWNATRWDSYKTSSGVWANRYTGFPAQGWYDPLGFSGDSAPTVDKSGWIPVTPGEQYVFTCRAGKGADVQDWQAYFVWAGPDGVEVAPRVTSDWVTTTRNISVEATVPAGADRMIVRITCRGPNATGNASTGYFSVYGMDLSLRKKVGSVLIENGAVNADKITASQELSAKVAEFLSVKTGQITWDNAAGNNAFIGSLVGNDAFLDQLQASQISVSASNLVMFTPTLPAVLYGGLSGVTVTPRTDAQRGGFYTFGGGTGTDGTLADCAHLTTKCVAGNVGGRIACAPGDKFSLSARLGIANYHGSAADGAEARRGRIRVSFYDADNVYITGSQFGGSTANAWDYGKGNLSELQVTAPSNARYMAVFLQSALWSSGSLTMTELRVSRTVGSVLIENGAVTAPKITASEELSAKVAEFIEVETGKITWDNAAGNQAFIRSLISDNAFFKFLYSDKVVVSPGNLLPDPLFAQREAWSFSSYVNPDNGMTGGGSLLIPATTTLNGTYTGILPDRMVYNPQVITGSKYLIGAWFRSAVASTSTASVLIYYRWYNESGRQIGNISSIGADPFSNGVWTNLSGVTSAAPAGATRIAFGLYVSASHNSDVRFSDPYVRSMTGAVLIENGAVTAPKIASKAITAEKIEVGALDAFQITSPLIQSVSTANRGIKWNGNRFVAYNTFGEEIIRLEGDTGNITGVTITGGTIRTAASGQRIQLVSSGDLYAYAPNGLETLRIQTADDGGGATYFRGPAVGAQRSYLRLGRGVLGGTDTAQAWLGFDGGNRPSRLWVHSYGAFYVGGERGSVQIDNATGEMRLYSSAGLIGLYGIPTTTNTGQPLTMIYGGSMWSTYRNTSLAKYKLDQRDLSADDPYRVLQLRPRDWWDKTAMDQVADGMEAEFLRAEGEEVPEHLALRESMPLPHRVPGFVAEEVEAVIPELATWDGDGNLSGVAYDRVPAYLLVAMKAMKTEIDELREQLERGL